MYRAEFIDVMHSLLRGNTLVVADIGSTNAVIDGNIIYHTLPTLTRYDLVEEFDNPVGFRGVTYMKLTVKGRAFAERAVAEWAKKPLLERLALRFIG